MDLDCFAEPGIRCGNEDFRGNENQKLWNKIFLMAKKSTGTHFFSMKIKMMVL